MTTPNTERILCAAIRFDDAICWEHQPRNIETGRVFCGHRHHNIFMLRPEEYNEVPQTQGFLASKNRFVGRQEGLAIARLVEQLKPGSPISENILFSEDLY